MRKIFMGAIWLMAVAGAAWGQVRVVVWDERQPAQKQAYENFIGNYIAGELGKREGIAVRSVALADPDQGLPDSVLENCDVLIWWAHLRHGAVKDELARKIVDRIVAGKMSMITLHSACYAKPFVLAMEERARIDALAALPEKDRAGARVWDTRRKLQPATEGEKLTPFSEVSRSADGKAQVMLTLPTCAIGGWREDGKPSHVTIRSPEHPIAKGLPMQFDLPRTEMYNEPFEVPAPDTVVFEEKWDRGEHFRGGCVWKVGKGQVMFFRPGHETFPVYKDERVMRILENAVRWMASK